MSATQKALLIAAILVLAIIIEEALGFRRIIQHALAYITSLNANAGAL